MLDTLRADYISVDPKNFGVSVLHTDPPVLLIENFLSSGDCDALREAGAAHPSLQASMIGSGTVGSSVNYSSAHRTSSTLLCTPEALVRATPALSEGIEKLRRRIKEVFSACTWSAPGKLPAPGVFCFEHAQVTQYAPGQHFGSHEDAFPIGTARSNGFQRRATVLVYLNDCAEGGRTHFDELGVSAPPKRGSALIFFPAFADGMPDDRTLHAAKPAVDEKWVVQQWVACGVPAHASSGGFSIDVPEMAVQPSLFGSAISLGDAPAAVKKAVAPSAAVAAAAVAPAAPVVAAKPAKKNGFGGRSTGKKIK